MRHNDVSKRLTPRLIREFQRGRPGQQWLFLTSGAILIFTLLACGFFEASPRSAPDRVVIRKHLPTLTPTPLPALSPTLVPSSEQAIPLAVEPIVVSPTSVPILTSTPASSGPTLMALTVLNVRSGPGLDYPIIGQLAEGQSVQIIGKNPENSWWQISYPSGSGSPAWVTADIQYAMVYNTEGVPVAQLPPVPTNQASPSAELPSSPTPTPGPTAIAGPGGWAFVGVRLSPNPDDGGMVLYGNAVNQTGTAQELLSVAGIFYDGQGQVIADASQTYAYWPSYVVPAGGSMPFELIVDEIANAARYDLSVEAEANSESPRQDFEFAQVNQWAEDDAYCLEGVVHNSGEPLDKYLVVAAVLYDSQNNLVNFSDNGDLGPEAGSDNSPFEICVNLSNQPVARHELLAWGR